MDWLVGESGEHLMVHLKIIYVLCDEVKRQSILGGYIRTLLVFPSLDRIIDTSSTSSPAFFLPLIFLYTV